MPHTEENSFNPLRSRLLRLGSLAVVAVGVAFAASAQPTLPLPTPGANPPAAVPGVRSDEAAKARAAALAAKANIDVTDAWTRATNGNATTADVYLHIVSAKEPDKLMSVDAAMAKDVELRQAPNAGELPLDVPAGGTISFAPNGEHLTLVGLKAPLKEGDSFLVTFHFDKAGTQNTAVKILPANANGIPPATLARRGDTTASVSQH
jgi:copper(I)-binding protein